MYSCTTLSYFSYHRMWLVQKKEPGCNLTGVVTSDDATFTSVFCREKQHVRVLQRLPMDTMSSPPIQAVSNLPYTLLESDTYLHPACARPKDKQYFSQVTFIVYKMQKIIHSIS